MAASLILGVCFAFGHHYYYHWLNGRLVGGIARQQWALRFGNAFATLVAACLKTAVGIAYIQYLWRTLRHRFVSLKTINDAFGIEGNILSFLNWEFWWDIRIGAVIALILWCIPLSTLLTPATLSVGRPEISGSADMEVLTMDISNSTLERAFTYRTRADLWVAGASARLSRIFGTVVSGGERLSFEPPSLQPNTSYDAQAYVPLMQCNTANISVQNQIIEMVAEAQGSDSPTGGYSAYNDDKFPLDKETFHWRINMTSGDMQAEGDLGYFAVVPFYEGNNISFWWNAAQTRTIPANTFLGQLWIAIAEYPNNQTQMQFVNCELYNASVSFTVNFTNHVPSINSIEKKWLNEVNLFQKTNDNDLVYVLHSYSAYFQGICSYLFGSVSWYTDTLGALRFISIGETMNTNLAKSSQWYNMSQRIGTLAGSDGQVVGPENVRNSSLAEEIEGFALNSSLSIMNDPTLSKWITANVTTTFIETVYVYEATNLFLSYGLAILFTTLCVFSGSYAFYLNGVSYDATVSTFAATMQSHEIKEILRRQSTGAQPMDRSMGKLKLRFNPEGGFVPKGSY
ncbi:hypothetical protein AOQ84DRAFT_367485 [Glonium stellatum]|uniref:Transmembrane protein n=1 Tax=Glonium stellatum TaxID=574774 RepID=A0A8E2ETA0_9PEZI|nr:hypothetical protein AOQ84DRAFT_367485 [Glonium stellatum]